MDLSQSLNHSSESNRNVTKITENEDKVEDFIIKTSFSRIESHENVFRDVLRALVAYCAPSSIIAHDNSQASTLITSLMDSQNVAEISKSKNVNRSFIEERGVRPISLYKGLFVDKRNCIIMTRCCNAACESKLPLTEALSKYKSCHHCYTYYCSPQCRQTDWENHKMKKCPLGRTVSVAKSVIKRILNDETCHNLFSRLGRGGYLRMGRGCIVLWFNSCDEAQAFSDSGSRILRHCPVYVCIKQVSVIINQFVPNSLSAIHEACMIYDPGKSIVVNVSISMEKTLIKSNMAQVRHDKVHAIKKCVILSLSKSFLDLSFINKYSDPLRSSSLLLTMLPGQQDRESLSHKDREVIFINILRQLEARGVNLKSQYPYLYNNLTKFVKLNSVVSPAIIYPIDSATERHFVCMIAPLCSHISGINPCIKNPSNRHSASSFIAELEAVIPNFEISEITDL